MTTPPSPEEFQALIAEGHAIDARLRDITAEVRQFAITNWHWCADLEILLAQDATPTQRLDHAATAAEYRANAEALTASWQAEPDTAEY